MNQELPPDVASALLPAQSGKTVYLLVGNPLRGDDGAGVLIADQLFINQENIVVIPAEAHPENAFFRILEIGPAKTVILDAADFGGRSGEVRVFNASVPHRPTFSTHRFPLQAVAKLIEKDTEGEVFLIGIQIRCASPDAAMDDGVRKACRLISEFIGKAANGPIAVQ